MKMPDTRQQMPRGDDSMSELEARYLELSERLNSLESEKRESEARKEERNRDAVSVFYTKWDPRFLKRKLFMATVMLLTSAVMLGMSTYAWFILSTAPELSGLAAMAGANGSLEIALLNDETGVDLTKITANKGQSAADVGIVESNVTWGNVVDMGHESYGLSKILLYPSLISGETQLDLDSILSIPRNGTDGRIRAEFAKTSSYKFSGSDFSSSDNGYGVRMIGSTTSPRTTDDGMTAFYGYAVDLAFRCNETTTLQLQTDAVNRVYSDGSEGTMGGGSKLTFKFAEGKSMSAEQVTKLFNAMRVVFFNRQTGDIYATALPDSTTLNSTSDGYEAALHLAEGNSLLELTAGEPKSVSVLFYLDGENLDNVSVINAKSSGTMLMNLQFSSSVELNPMIDDELKLASAADEPSGGRGA